MTELQLLIRDSNGMPPVIRADYLEDHGYEIEADWLRLGEQRRYIDARGCADGSGGSLSRGCGYGYSKGTAGTLVNGFGRIGGNANSYCGFGSEPK